MKSIVLDEIPFALDIADLQRRLHLAYNGESAGEFRELAEEGQHLARPKAVFMECYVEHRGADSVTLGTVTFTSPALRANLDQVERVFPYVATCGREIDRLVVPTGDFLRQYWLDAIKAALLERNVSTVLRQHPLEFSVARACPEVAQARASGPGGQHHRSAD